MRGRVRLSSDRTRRGAFTRRCVSLRVPAAIPPLEGPMDGKADARSHRGDARRPASMSTHPLKLAIGLTSASLPAREHDREYLAATASGHVSGVSHARSSTRSGHVVRVRRLRGGGFDLIEGLEGPKDALRGIASYLKRPRTRHSPANSILDRTIAEGARYGFHGHRPLPYVTVFQIAPPPASTRAGLDRDWLRVVQRGRGRNVPDLSRMLATPSAWPTWTEDARPRPDA